MAKRSKIQLELAFGGEATGEARNVRAGGTEAIAAGVAAESPAALAGPCMEAIVERDNLKEALARVKRNKGAPGMDGMTVEALGAHLKDHWPTIRARLLDGSYEPQPVRRVEIPKPAGGVRALGVPTGSGPLRPAGGLAGAAGALALRLACHAQGVSSPMRLAG